LNGDLTPENHLRVRVSNVGEKVHVNDLCDPADHVRRAFAKWLANTKVNKLHFSLRVYHKQSPVATDEITTRIHAFIPGTIMNVAPEAQPAAKHATVLIRLT